MSEKALKYFTRTFKILQDTVVCSISEAISISEVWSLHVLPASLWSHSRYSGFLQQFFGTEVNWQPSIVHSANSCLSFYVALDR